MLKDKVQALSGKVTGMILDGQTIEFLLHLCKSQRAFIKMAEEVMSVLRKAQKLI